jgi:hypothetical protein
MADTSELESALVKADAAGNVDDARQLAAAIRAARGTQSTPPASDKIDAPFVPPESDAPQAKEFTETLPSGNTKVHFADGSVKEYLGPTAGLMAGQEVNKGVPVPRVIKDVALEGGGATAGQALGALGGPAAPVTIPLGGSVGGIAGNYAAQKLRIASGEQDKIHWGELIGAALTGAIPGASLESAGAKSIAKEAVKQGAGGLARNIVQTGIDEGKLPSVGSLAASTLIPAAGGALAQKVQLMNPEVQAAQAAAKNAPKSLQQQRYEAGKALGLKTSGGELQTDENGLSRLVGAPPHVIRNELSARNSEPISEAVNKELGLPHGTEITPDVLDDFRAEKAQPYAEIASMADAAKKKIAEIEKSKFNSADPRELQIQQNDPATLAELAPLKAQAAADVEGLKAARKAASLGYAKHYGSPGGDPAALEGARNADALADKLEAQIEAAAESIGDPTLINRLRTARTDIAKSYDVQRALTGAAGEISATKLGAMLKGTNPKPLSGNLKTIAEFANEFPAAVKPASGRMAPGITRTEALAGGLMAAEGIAKGGAKGALLGLAPLAGRLKRNFVLSDFYQNKFPLYPKAKIAPDVTPAGALAIRQAAQAAGASAADDNN